jgi:CRISPR-associated protein Cst1
MELREIDSYIYDFTGNPFVDAGIASLCALTGKKDPKLIDKDDIRKAVKYISTVYLDWQYLGNYFTGNFFFLNPNPKMRKEGAMRYKNHLEKMLEEVALASQSGSCSTCGSREANILVGRHEYPLTGSGDFLNYFSFFEEGFPICAPCAIALHMAPLYLVSNKGQLFLAHSHNQKIMLELAVEAMVHIKKHVAPVGKLMFYKPSFQFSNINEFLVRVARHLVMKADAQYGPTTIRIYSFRNSLRPEPFLNFIDLPTEVFVFLEKAKLSGMNRNIDELFDNSSSEIFRRLVDGGSIRYFFIRLKERRIVGGWDLFELYLMEVEKMDREKLEVIKKVGKRVYDYLKATNNFKKLRDLETEDFKEFKMALERIQKETLVWEIDDYPILFLQDEKGRVLWRETQSILLGYIYELIHKNKE